MGAVGSGDDPGEGLRPVAVVVVVAGDGVVLGVQQPRVGGVLDGHGG